jgi:hypothetical protein
VTGNTTFLPVHINYTAGKINLKKQRRDKSKISKKEERIM